MHCMVVVGFAKMPSYPDLFISVFFGHQKIMHTSCLSNKQAEKKNIVDQDSYYTNMFMHTNSNKIFKDKSK